MEKSDTVLVGELWNFLHAVLLVKERSWFGDDCRGVPGA